MSNPKIQVLKTEVVNLNKQLNESTIKTIKEAFIPQVDNLLSRYIKRKDDSAINVEKIANDLLNAYHTGGIDAVNAIDREQYGDMALLFQWLKTHIRGDIKKGNELPKNVDASMAKAKDILAKSEEATRKHQAAAQAAAEKENARRNALSPEERKREDMERESDAMYGISPSLRAAVKEAYRKMKVGEPLSLADKGALENLRQRERYGLGS